MQWNVMRYNINTNKIETYNIFKHSSLTKEVEELLQEKFSKEQFSEKLRRIVQYYFWSKSEHEIVITSWPPYIDQQGFNVLKFEHENYYEAYGHYPKRIQVDLNVNKKIDIYDQVMLNWDIFCDYVWTFQQESEENSIECDGRCLNCDYYDTSDCLDRK